MKVEELKSILNYDKNTGIFTRIISRRGISKKGNVVGILSANGYLRVKINNVNYYLHRLAWLYVYEDWPKNQIDHINRKRNDNRIENLRDVIPLKNQQNLSISKKNKSGFNGVNFDKRSKKWKASIRFNKVKIYLGLFEKLEDAAEVAFKTKEKLNKEYFNDKNGETGKITLEVLENE